MSHVIFPISSLVLYFTHDNADEGEGLAHAQENISHRISDDPRNLDRSRRSLFRHLESRSGGGA